VICPQCSNGFLAPSLPVPLVLKYRGFSKQVAAQEFLECTNCRYESAEPISSVDVDAETAKFRREVNMKLSVGEI